MTITEAESLLAQLTARTGRRSVTHPDGTRVEYDAEQAIAFADRLRRDIAAARGNPSVTRFVSTGPK